VEVFELDGANTLLELEVPQPALEMQIKGQHIAGGSFHQAVACFSQLSKDI
jgi:hypothetical protein